MFACNLRKDNKRRRNFWGRSIYTIRPVVGVFSAFKLFCLHYCYAFSFGRILYGDHRLIDFQPGGGHRKVPGHALDALQRGEQPVGPLSVHPGDLHRMVSLRAQVLQRQGGRWSGLLGGPAAAADELSLRHQDLPQVHTVHLLCAAETTVPLG